MMFYVLWRLSLEPGVPAVVVQTAQNECLAFTRGQRVYKGDDIASFANLLELPGTWLLTHEKFDPEISQGASASLLLITSRHFGTGQVHLCLISAWPALHIATLLHTGRAGSHFAHHLSILGRHKLCFISLTFRVFHNFEFLLCRN